MSDEMILYDSPEAAHQEAVIGWVSRHGRFFGANESNARWDGCTHIRCRECGRIAERARLSCADCREEKAVRDYLKMPEAEWDGECMLYSDAHDRWFHDPDEAEEYAQECNDNIENLRLILCVPVYMRQLEEADWLDDLPEECGLPPAADVAVNRFNEAIKGIVLGWQPGQKRLKSGTEEEGK